MAKRATSDATGSGLVARSVSPAGSRTTPACSHTCSRRAAGAARSGGAGGRSTAADGEWRLVERGQRGPASEHEALQQRVGGEAVGAVDAGRGALPRRVQPADLRPAQQVGDDPADGVVRGRRDRDRLRRGIEPRLRDLGHQAGKPAPIDRPEIEECPAPLDDRARDLVARRQLVDESLAVLVEQPCALAPESLRQQQPGALENGRVELHELHVRDRRARRHGDGHGVADLAGRVRGSRPQGGRAAHREDRRSGRDRSLRSGHADAPPARNQEREHGGGLAGDDPLGRGRAPAQQARDRPSSGGAVHARHAAARVTAFEAHLRIERNAHRDQLAQTLGALFHENPDRARPAQLATGFLRVDGVEFRGVVVADRPGYSALGVPAARIRERGPW